MLFDSINPLTQLCVDNLTINQIKDTDVDAVVNYVQENKSFLVPWEPKRQDSYYTKLGWEKRIYQLQQMQRHGFYYQFLIRDGHQNNALLGLITYSNIIHFPMHACVVGYSLAEKAQGKGIMQKALKATNQALFDEINLHRIVAAYMPRNYRSAAVLSKLGFEIEGKAKSYLLINDVWEDHILTSLINPDWIRPDRS